MNFESLLPYLNQHGLLTRDEHEDLINPLHTSAMRVSKLLVWLPRKGSRFLYRFVECLQQSAEECPPHKELRDLLQRTIRNTVHRQASRGQYNYTVSNIALLLSTGCMLHEYWTCPHTQALSWKEEMSQGISLLPVHVLLLSTVESAYQFIDSFLQLQGRT